MPITYTRDIPDAPNNPSVDQGPMKINTNSIDTIIAVDHYTFADVPSGTHKQVTLSGKNVPLAPTDPVSVVYSNSGTASTASQLNYRNQNGIFPLSCVRAWASFAGASGAILGSQAVNATVARVSAGVYTVTVTANALSTVNYAVLLSATNFNPTILHICGYAITSATQFTITTELFSGSPSDPSQVSFMVLQI